MLQHLCFTYFSGVYYVSLSVITRLIWLWLCLGNVWTFARVGSTWQRRVCYGNREWPNYATVACQGETCNISVYRTLSGLHCV